MQKILDLSPTICGKIYSNKCYELGFKTALLGIKEYLNILNLKDNLELLNILNSMYLDEILK